MCFLDHNPAAQGELAMKLQRRKCWSLPSDAGGVGFVANGSCRRDGAGWRCDRLSDWGCRPQVSRQRLD
jgi:hypothetical protein